MTVNLTTEQLNEIAFRNLVKEIHLIRCSSIRIFITRAVLAAPGRYWIKPSGNHPGHHPDDEHGDWGNLIHVKRVIVIAEMLTEAENLDSIHSDILYAGLIIHDLGKYGVDGTSDHMDSEHPLKVHYIVRNIEPCSRLAEVLEVAQTHMGRWGTRKPDTVCEKLGHYADYIASRSAIHIPVELDV